MTNRGWSNTVLGNYPQAIADYEAALAIDPGSVLALLDRAWTHALMGNPQLGLSDADAALAMAPGRPAALFPPVHRFWQSWAARMKRWRVLKQPLAWAGVTWFAPTRGAWPHVGTILVRSTEVMAAAPRKP